MNFSIGICAYNEEENIGELLKGLLSHKTKHYLHQIIVVSSGSTDGTDEIIYQYARKDDRVKVIIESERKGKYSAVNQILKNNQSDILVMVDADCLIECGAIDYLLPNLDKPGIGAVCGKTVPLNDKNTFWGHIADFRYRMFDEFAWLDTKNGNFCHLSGYLYAMRKGLIDKMPAIIQDDLYIGHTIKGKGYKVLYEPHARVNIMHPTSIGTLIKQRRRIRLGHLELEKLTGHHVSTTNPLRVILAMVRVMDYTPQKVLYTLIVGFFEQYAVFLAQRDFKKNKIDPVSSWKYIDTSKKLK